MSRVKGIISTRRLLKRMPDAVRAELGATMQQAGPELANAMTARAPRRTGALISGITWRFYPATLRLVVGFIGRKINRQLFYARIMEGGRRAQTVTVTRRGKAAIGRRGKRLVNGRKPFEDIVSTYQLRVKPLAPRRFVYGPLTNLRQVMSRRLNNIWDRVLSRAATGVGDE